MNIYSEQDKQFLIENYPKYGSKYCSDVLNRPKTSIKYEASKLKLSSKNYYPHPSTQTNFKFDILKNPTKEFAYFLGYMWADGYMRKNYRKGSNKCSYSVGLEIVSEDYQHIKNIFKPFITFSTYTRKRNSTWQQTTVCGVNNKYLYEFLENLNFKNKILGIDKIAEYCKDNNLLEFFLMGYFDGDGYCNFSTMFEISGPIDTNWDYLQNIFKCNNINACVYKHTNLKGHKSSKIKIQNRIGINWFVENILNQQPDMGLKRKRPIQHNDE